MVELFGRNSGETSLFAAYLAGVDRGVISEVPFDIEKLGVLLLEDKRSNPSNYAIMTISEGAQMTGGTSWSQALKTPTGTRSSAASDRSPVT